MADKSWVYDLSFHELRSECFRQLGNVERLEGRIKVTDALVEAYKTRVEQLEKDLEKERARKEKMRSWYESEAGGECTDKDLDEALRGYEPNGG